MNEVAAAQNRDTFPWLAHYPPGTPHSVDEQCAGRTLNDLFQDSRRDFAKRPVLESFGVSLTYELAGEYADRVATFLQSRGLKKGDRVAIMMPNVAAYIPILFGILKAGCVVVNNNPLYTARELSNQLKDSGAKCLFFISLFEETVAAARERHPLESVVRVEVGELLGLKGRLISVAARRKAGVKRSARMPDAIAFKDALNIGARHPFEHVDVAPEDLAFLQYTGGTTGVAKGAMLQHSNVNANVEQCTAWFGPSLDLNGQQQVMIGALPLYHIFALTACAFLSLRLGMKTLLIANPRDLNGFIKTLQKRRFTIFVGINTLYAALADHPNIGKVDFSGVELCISGGMATKAVVAEKWKKTTGFTIVEGYGLSETSPGVTFNRPDLSEFTGSIGYPWPSTEVQIRGLVDDAPGDDGVGEIVARGPQVMRGYWNRPEETSNVFTHDGFFRTGDMGVLLEDGQVKLVDRLKEMINVSGFNVYPNEIEDVIIEMPGVREVAVVGLPHDASGERVAAFIVKRDDGVTEQQVVEHCRQMLTQYKIPKFVEFVDELPKSNVGKVLRRVLKDNVVNSSN